MFALFCANWFCRQKYCF